MNSLLPLRKTVREYLSVVITSVLVIAMLTAALISGSGVSGCGTYRDDGQAIVGGAVIKVERPRSPDEFAKGLGGRPCILPDQGMLFVFSQPGQYSFWMKDMRFPIDILWIGPDHRVVYEVSDLQPSSYPRQFTNQAPALYVLETKADLSKTIHDEIGTPINF